MNAKVLLAGIAIFLLTMGAGVYGKDLSRAENVGYQVAVPAGTVSSSVVVNGAGQPVPMAPLTLNLAQRGLPKMLFSGNSEKIETHRIANVGTTPLRIRMEMVNTSTVHARVHVNANFGYDEATHTFTEPLMPGKSIPGLGMSWFFDFPPEKRYDPVVYDGGLRFTNADTGELLTFLPIQYVNRDPSFDPSAPVPSGTPAEACH